jgi:hypothetical protein
MLEDGSPCFAPERDGRFLHEVHQIILAAPALRLERSASLAGSSRVTSSVKKGCYRPTAACRRPTVQVYLLVLCRRSAAGI